MNKGLELIEAHLLFDVPVEDITVVVHPQSVVHSMVEFVDGSTLAQASPPDMRLPIALGLSWPDRVPQVAPPCDWTQATAWTFEPLDEDVFAAVAAGPEAVAASATHPAVYNAANEECVEAFLAGRIGFLDIVTTVERVLGRARRHGAGRPDARRRPGRRGLGAGPRAGDPGARRLTAQCPSTWLSRPPSAAGVTGPGLGAVGPRRRPPGGRDAGPAQRLRLPGAGSGGPTHGSRTRALSAPVIRSASVRPARLVERDAVADVPARPARSRSRGRARRTACQSRGTPSGPPQRWVISARSSTGNRSTSSRTQVRGASARPGRTSGRMRGAQVVRRTAPAEREPVVGRPLAVDDQVPRVGERLRAVQADLRPDLGRQRLGGDHVGVDRGDVAAPTRAACAVHASVARTTQRARTMPWSVTTARGDRRRARVPSASRAPRDSTTSSRPRTSRAGWIARAVGRERAADRTVGADVLGHPVGAEQVRLVAPPGVGARRRRPRAPAAGGCGRR